MFPNRVAVEAFYTNDPKIKQYFREKGLDLDDEEHFPKGVLPSWFEEIVITPVKDHAGNPLELLRARYCQLFGSSDGEGRVFERDMTYHPGNMLVKREVTFGEARPYKKRFVRKN